MRFVLTTLIGIVVISVLPAPAQAQSNVGQTVATFGAGVLAGSLFNSLATGMTKTADAMCAVYIPTHCACHQQDGPKGSCIASPSNTFNCPVGTCVDHTANSTTLGKCTGPYKCLAVTTAGAGGSSSGVGLSQVVGILGQLAGQLLKGSSGSASAPAVAPTAATSCPNGTYITSVVSSDPCAVYVPAAISSDSTSLNANTTSDLLNALNGTSGSLDTAASSTAVVSTDDVLNQLSGDSANSLQATVSQSTTTTLNPVAGNVFAQSANLLPGLTGDIALLGNGATFVANNRDQGSNSAVAGFYGGDTTLGTQPTGLVASWCQSRPWASNFLSAVIPPTFFDGLCTLRGYTVGTPPAAGNSQSQVTITQSPIQPVQTTTNINPASPIGNNPPVVDIWASPKTVSIGARTSIFWTSSGAASCTVTSPDGSFSQRSLTGGASTVAITTATVFTISCLAPDGSHATKDVTVNLAI